MKKIVVVIFSILFLSFFCSEIVYAAESVDGNKAVMRKGVITYETYDTTATSGTIWKTEGFTIKKERTKGDPTKAPKGEIWLSAGEKYSEELANGKTYTRFTFNEEKVREVFDKAGIDGDSLEASGGYVYLNGIFRVYKNGRAASGYKKTLYSIKNAAPWRNPDDFEDRFDIQIKYEPVEELQPVYLTIMKRQSKKLIVVDRIKIGEVSERSNFRTKAGKLENGKIPTTIETEKGTLYLFRTHWAKMLDEETEHKNGVYRKVKDKKSTKINPKLALEAYTESLKDLRERKYNVPYGGIEIVCVYRKFKKGGTNTSTETVYDIDEPYATGIIQADTRGNEQFNSAEGIPTTETQYVNVITTEYLTQYRFKNYSGTRTYLKKIPGAANEDGTKQPDTYVEVARRFSYWKIVDLNVYKLSGADIENGSLPGATIHLDTSSAYKAPTVSYKVYSNNMKEPVSGAEEIGMIEVRNDRLVFNGQTIMDGSWCVTSADKPDTIPEAGDIDINTLYRSGLQIGWNKANGEYESIGTVTYTRVCHYGSNAEGDTAEYDIEDINNVIVHTPTICDGRVEDVRSYNQMLQPNQSVAGIVLDQNFNIELPTSGYHTEMKGYEYRDYGKYIAKREVRFPFDVYKGMTYCKADTWIPLTSDTTEFYLPIWVDEGEYTVEFRSRTINCDANNGLDWQEDYANIDYENYAAVDFVDVEVSGRIYGLTLYDISDTSIWKQVFRKADSLALSGFTYTVGNKNQNGISQNKNSKYTFVMVNGSHPANPNLGVQKTGYVSRFHLTTVGNLYSDTDYISVKPAFYYIDAQGSRQEVDLYYTETIKGERNTLVKAGSSIDLSNQKTMKAGDVYTSIPVSELDEKARLEGKSPEEVKSIESKVYTFTNIIIPQELRTYIGQNYTPTGTIPAGVDADKAAKSMQKWYFEYYLPSEIYICQKGFDVAAYAKVNNGLDMKEDFWLKNGYLLVNFEIQTVHEGERKLSYTNVENAANGYCNMWKLEGYQYAKIDNQEKIYHFKDGDTLFYYLKQSAGLDYLTGGTH